MKFIRGCLVYLSAGRDARLQKVTFITPVQLPDLVNRDQSFDTDRIHPCNLRVGANET